MHFLCLACFFGLCCGLELPPYSELSYPTLCGVIGGIGPAASANFLQKYVTGQTTLLIELQKALQKKKSPDEIIATVTSVSTANWTSKEVDRLAKFPQDITNAILGDQHQAPIIVYSNPQIPDRTEYLLKHMSEITKREAQILDPSPSLRRTALSLINGGATCIAVSCNTAHFFLSAIKKVVPAGIRILDMISLTFQHIMRKFSVPRQPGDVLKIGLLATTGTVQTGIYNDVARKFPLSVITPVNLTDGNQSAVHEAIYGMTGIKAGYSLVSTPEGKRNLDLLNMEALKLVAAGCVAVIAGCTELPLVLTDSTAAQGVHVVDPTQILADEIAHITFMDRVLPAMKTSSSIL